MRNILKVAIGIVIGIVLISYQVLLGQLVLGHKSYYQVLKTHESKLNYLKEKLDYSLDWDKIMLSVVVVKQGVFVGTGTIIDQDMNSFYILTCKHCTTEKDSIVIAVPTKDMFLLRDDITQDSATIYEVKETDVIRSEKFDLAYIKVNKNKNEVFNLIPIAKQRASTGDRVWNISHPANCYFNLVNGVVSSDLNKYAFRTNAAIFGGTSGSAVLNIKGEVIGVYKSIWTIEETHHKKPHQTKLPLLNFAVSLDAIQEFLKEAEQKLK